LEPEVSLAVRLSDQIPAKADSSEPDEEDILDEFFAEHGFEYVNVPYEAKKSEEGSVSGANSMCSPLKFV
jgi:hypothetical protein